MWAGGFPYSIKYRTGNSYGIKKRWVCAEKKNILTLFYQVKCIISHIP